MTLPDYATALELLGSRLEETSFAHSKRVAMTAASLARTYDVDVDAARLAGLLHDWDRELGPDELVDAAGHCDTPIDPVEMASPYLLHARTGAHALRELLPGLPDEILEAVRRHTVGAAEMSDLDMVVWIADMIEPARTFDGVGELRAEVGVLPLSDLFAAAYRRSVAHVVECGKPLHPDTVAVWNRYVAGCAR